MDKKQGPGLPDGQAWVHRQNIARFQALLNNSARENDHGMIRRLLIEEQEKLRALGEG